MTALAIVGWVLAAVAVAAGFGVHRMLGNRMEAVARACHELRGPLTAVKLGLEWGLRAGGLTPARLRAIDLELDRATLALGDLAGTRRGGWREPVDVPGLLVDSVEAWRAAAAARGSRLTVSWSGGSGLVVGDRIRLAQATGNLIANAIEHGGGEIEVRGRTDGPSVRIEVRDEGPGLRAPLSELGAQRRRWRVAPDRARGHGLAVAAAVATAHGGRLAAAPSERGARLVLELPAANRLGQDVDDLVRR